MFLAANPVAAAIFHILLLKFSRSRPCPQNFNDENTTKTGWSHAKQ